MALVSVGLLTGRGLYHLVQRGILKKGDKGIATLRESQTGDDQEGVSYLSPKAHILHQQHPLSFEDGGEFLCNACNKRGPSGGRYSCRDCDFNLHLACATSEEMWELSTQIMTDFKTPAHEHTMKLETPTMSNDKYTKFTCSHCHNKGYSLLRYQCEEGEGACHSQMHFVCAVSPTLLLSFLHPDHVLEFKTRHHLKNCAVCNHGGKLNARVYVCEECDFFVHPDCAQRRQYFQFSLHEEGHTLVYQELADDQNQQAKAICRACDRECKHWSYTCHVCPGVHFHRECIVKYYYPHYPAKIGNYGLKAAGKEGLLHVGLEVAIALGKVVITTAATGAPLF
uniref:Zinc finger PHD-type domain-containing protein n=1 Tax=Opuntia streptacantha TaxID=393608 RepID=A0A7C9EPQ4_OPUST